MSVLFCFFLQHDTQEETQKHLSPKLLTSASSPFVQANRLQKNRISQSPAAHPPPRPQHVSFLFPHGRSQTPPGLSEPLFPFTTPPVWRTRHGEHSLPALRRGPKHKAALLPAAQTTAQTPSHSLAMAGSSSLPATRFLLLVSRLSEVPAQRPGPGPPRGRHAGAPQPRAPHQGPGPHPSMAGTSSLPFPSPPLLFPGRQKL